MSSATLAGAAPFIRKCATLRALRNVGPCIQILVADHFHKEAFAALRAAGIIAATPKSLFGTEVAEALRELTSALAIAAWKANATTKYSYTLVPSRSVSKTSLVRPS